MKTHFLLGGFGAVLVFFGALFWAVGNQPTSPYVYSRQTNFAGVAGLALLVTGILSIIATAMIHERSK